MKIWRTFSACSVRLLTMYLLLPSKTYLVTMMRSSWIIDGGLAALFLLSKMTVTLALTTPFINQLLQIGNSHMRQARNAKNEANGVNDIRFTGPVETGNGVEILVNLGNMGLRRIRLEPVKYDFLYVHIDKSVTKS